MKKLSIQWNDWLALIGFLLLIAIIPLRHVVMDNSGAATALVIGSLLWVALLIGFRYEWKSAWCSGLCPIHQVERLYGSRALLTTKNAHCHACERCVLLCPDSIPALNPLTGARSGIRRFTGTLLTGGFAGYIYGWFQVPNYSGGEGWNHLALAYGYPFAGFAVSLLLYLALTTLTPKRHKDLLIRAFACAAVACYYWFRIPALFGYGLYPGDGMLVDLTRILPTYFPLISQGLTLIVFTWLLLLRPASKRSWARRPERGTLSQALRP